MSSCLGSKYVCSQETHSDLFIQICIFPIKSFTLKKYIITPGNSGHIPYYRHIMSIMNGLGYVVSVPLDRLGHKKK